MGLQEVAKKAEHQSSCGRRNARAQSRRGSKLGERTPAGAACCRAWLPGTVTALEAAAGVWARDTTVCRWSGIAAGLSPPWRSGPSMRTASGQRKCLQPRCPPEGNYEFVHDVHRGRRWDGRLVRSRIVARTRCKEKAGAAGEPKLSMTR